MIRQLAAAAIVLVVVLVCTGATLAENPQGQYFNRGGVQLYAETTGDLSDGPVMIFMGGSAANTKIWSGAVDHYKRKFPTVAFDLRGTGLSDGPLDSPYSFAMFADDVHFVLQQLGVTEVICVGGNFGANVCLQLEYAHNDTIAIAATVLSGGNPLTVAATRTPSLTPNAAAWEYSEFDYTVHYQLCWIINSTIAAPGNALYMSFLTGTGAAVFCDQCDNLDELRNAFVVTDSLQEDPYLQMRKLGCFGQNPSAWLFNNQHPILATLAANQTPRLILAGSENLSFSRGYTWYLGTKLLPPTNARPAGRSTPLVQTVVGHGNFVYATDVDTFTAKVDELLDYMETGTQLKKCDTIKV